MQYSVQRPGLNNVNRVKIKEEKKIKKDASGKMYVPMKVLFKSNYDRFGKIADNKSKELSQASLSSDSSQSVGRKNKDQGMFIFNSKNKENRGDRPDQFLFMSDDKKRSNNDFTIQDVNDYIHRLTDM